MGLLRRSRDAAPDKCEPHSHVALAPEDAEDAARGRPAESLASFAAARDLTFAGDDLLVAALVGVLPAWSAYVFNACRGELGPGRFGVLEHELYEIDVDPNDDSGSGISGMGGQFWAIRRGVPPGWKKRLIPGAEFLGMAEPANEPFAAHATWAPATTVALHVPEAACAPRIVVGPADRHSSLGTTALENDGVPGFRLLTEVPDDLRAAVFGGEAGRALVRVDAPFVRLEFAFGQLALTRNGYVTDEGRLDELIACALAIAAGVADAWCPNAATAPFAAPLAAPAPEEGRLAGIDGWDETFTAAAAKFGLTREDPGAYHAAFPRLQVPGRARGVFRGALPGGGAEGRLAFHAHGGPRGSALKGAALFAAPAGAEPTAPGGVLHQRTDMYVAVGDGIVACWNRTTDASGVLAITPTAERAQATARELGLLPAPAP